MTNTIWTNPVSGDWSDAGNWSAGVPAIATTAVINASGLYTVAISSADAANSLFVDAVGATLSEDSGGSLSLKRGLTLDSGTVSLNGANSFGGTTQLVGGTLELGNTAALGNSNLMIDGGALVGTANENFSNVLKTGGSFTMAAGDGDTVRLTSNTVIDMNSGGFINFGQTGDDGVFVWAPVTLGLDNNGTAGFDVSVNAGTLRDGNGNLSEVLSAATSVDIAANATVDIQGHADAIGRISGGGIISSTANGGSLTLGQGTFSGDIEGALALTVTGQLSLTGVNTQSGTTTVDGGAVLDLADLASIKGNVTLLNGATLDLLGSIGGRVTIEKGATLNWLDSGSIGGNITDNGILNLQFSNPTLVAIQGEISGSGSIILETGTVSLDGNSTYKGGTTLAGGILEVGSSSALGTGELVLSGGALLGTVTESLGNRIAVNGESAILAASGATLTLDASESWSIRNGVVFGNSANNGAIVWDMPTGSVAGTASKFIEINGGTLRAGNSNFQSLLDVGATHHGFTSIASDATLDVAGFAETIYNAEGNGTIANSGAAAIVTLSGGYFDGDLSGPITLDISGKTALGGDVANWNTIDLLTGAQLDIGSSSANIVFPTGSSAVLAFGDPGQFTGSVVGFSPGCEMLFPTLDGSRKTRFSVSYSGDTLGGTLTVSNQHGSAAVAVSGDYTNGTFEVYESLAHGIATPYVYFVPNPSATSAPADAFDFSSVPATQVALETGIAHLHGVQDLNDVALAHHVTEALHAHGFAPDHFTHDLFVHHAVPEALA